MGYGQKRRLKLMQGAHPVQLLETQYLTNEAWLRRAPMVRNAIKLIKKPQKPIIKSRV